MLEVVMREIVRRSRWVGEGNRIGDKCPAGGYSLLRDGVTRLRANAQVWMLADQRSSVGFRVTDGWIGAEWAKYVCMSVCLMWVAEQGVIRVSAVLSVCSQEGRGGRPQISRAADRPE